MAHGSSIPEAIKNLVLNMGFSDPVLVIQKRLTHCDLSRERDRLLIPLMRKIKKEEFLTEEEKTALNNGDSIEVTVMAWPRPVISDLALVKWVKQEEWGGATSSYALIRAWHTVMRQQGLRVHQKVQVWSCRRLEGLGFLLIAVEDEDEE